MLLTLLRCNSYREEFNRVASVVDAKFTIRKMYLGYYTTQSADTIGMLAAQVATQDTESHHHLEVERFWVGSSVGEWAKLLLQWIKFSKDWVIQTLVVYHIIISALKCDQKSPHLGWNGQTPEEELVETGQFPQLHQISLRDFNHQQIKSFPTLRNRPLSNPCILIDCFKWGTIGILIQVLES